MNQQRRKALQQIVADLQSAKEQVEALAVEGQEHLDNMPSPSATAREAAGRGCRRHTRQRGSMSANERAARQLDAAAQGDTEAALDLLVALPNAQRPDLLGELIRRKAPHNVQRFVALELWAHDHRHAIEAFGGREFAIFLRRLGAFDVTVPIARSITVYRGQASARHRPGLSWSTRPEVAHWFAWRTQSPEAAVLVRTVRGNSIDCTTDARNESEVLISRPARRFDVVAPSPWLALRYEAELEARRGLRMDLAREAA